MRPAGDPADARAIAEQTARVSYGRLLAYLAVRSRDLVASEDALAEAFATALRTWPERGVPDRPDAWLLAVARRRLVDQARHQVVADRAVEALLMRTEEAPSSDERLPLLFVCAHPAIDPAARTPLMLQVVLGLDAATIARAFLVSKASMAKRLVRAKEKIRRAGIPFEVPPPSQWSDRLRSVLDAIYAAYARGFDLGVPGDAPPVALDRDLEARHLAEVLVGLLPDEPEALGLLSLLCHVEARRAARIDATGTYVPLDDQDPTHWDADLVARAEAALHAAARHATLGRYQLEAAIQSAHVARRRDGVDTRAEIADLYATLVAHTGAIGAAIGHAAAIAAAQGAAAGLARLDGLPPAAVADHQPFWAVRADLLRQLGDPEARSAYERALALTHDEPAHRWLDARRTALDDTRSG